MRVANTAPAVRRLPILRRVNPECATFINDCLNRSTSTLRDSLLSSRQVLQIFAGGIGRPGSPVRSVIADLRHRLGVVGGIELLANVPIRMDAVDLPQSAIDASVRIVVNRARIKARLGHCYRRRRC
jgi:hypothetical protein